MLTLEHNCKLAQLSRAWSHFRDGPYTTHTLAHRDKNRSDRLCDIQMRIRCNSWNSLHGASIHPSSARVWLWHKRYTLYEFARAHPRPSSRLNYKYPSSSTCPCQGVDFSLNIETDTLERAMRKNHCVLGVLYHIATFLLATLLSKQKHEINRACSFSKLRSSDELKIVSKNSPAH